ncbi:hypothetical protein GE09DRAFT_1236467 [Coniochaeta sp. 2T2.1]|nr:hypothetical protein GE09DRAFT_1236467 [Coniochaeta sp. 2T2.1]
MALEQACPLEYNNRAFVVFHRDRLVVVAVTLPSTRPSRVWPDMAALSRAEHLDTELIKALNAKMNSAILIEFALFDCGQDLANLPLRFESPLSAHPPTSTTKKPALVVVADLSTPMYDIAPSFGPQGYFPPSAGGMTLFVGGYPNVYNGYVGGQVGFPGFNGMMPQFEMQQSGFGNAMVQPGLVGFVHNGQMHHFESEAHLARGKVGWSLEAHVQHDNARYSYCARHPALPPERTTPPHVRKSRDQLALAQGQKTITPDSTDDEVVTSMIARMSFQQGKPVPTNVAADLFDSRSTTSSDNVPPCSSWAAPYTTDNNTLGQVGRLPAWRRCEAEPVFLPAHPPDAEVPRAGWP